MELICYPLLSTRSKRAIIRRKQRRGHNSGKTYHYRPRQTLVKRLEAELNMSQSTVLRQIALERLFLLRQMYGEDEISPKDV
jgi:hypothetical protein